MARKKRVSSNETNLNEIKDRPVFNLSKDDRVILLKFAEKQFQYISYCLTKSKLFVPIGLELNSTSVIFETNDSFALKNITFGYFNPVTNSIHVNVEDAFFLGEKENPDTFNLCSVIHTYNFQMDFTAKILFIMFHEVNHKFFDHSVRAKTRIPTLWNIAADYEIHNMFYIYRQVFDPYENDSGMLNNYLKIIDEFLFDGKTFCFDEKYIENIAEEIYEMIMNSSSSSTTTYNFNMNEDGSISNDSNGGVSDSDEDNSNDSDDSNSSNSKDSSKKRGTVTVTETEYTLPNGKKYKTVDIKFNDMEEESNSSKNNSNDNKESVTKNSTALNKALSELTIGQIIKEKMKGNISAECKKFLKKMFHIKVDWQKILRNSLQNILEKTDYFGWNSIRTSTFLLNNMPYLPDVVEDNNKYGTLIIARDESGSMSEDDLRKAVKIIMDAKEHYKNIILLQHDTKISNIFKFEELDDNAINIICERKTCGGTSHKEIFEYLRDYKESEINDPISCFIGITDLESDVEVYQDIVPSKIPMMWLVPNADVNEAKYKDITGKIIPIE